MTVEAAPEHFASPPPATPSSLLAVLKALPADSLRSNLVSAFGRPQHDSNSARPPIASHQWLPGQWTPVLYGLSRDWRAFARSVLTHTLTVDLAITVSLQRPTIPGTPGNGLEILDTFLAGFPCLQYLTILAGNGGAPVDDSPRPDPDASSASNQQPGLAMADVETVAAAAQQLLRLDQAGWATAPVSAVSSRSSSRSGPRLTSLELRLHPAVWRTLRGSSGQDFLVRLTATHPALEAVTLHVAGTQAPASPTPGPDGSMGPAGETPVAEVGVSALAALRNLTTLRLVGPMAVEGLTALTHLQTLSLEGVARYSDASALELLPSLASFRVSDSHLRPVPAASISAKAPAADPAAAGAVLMRLRISPSALSLRALYLPDVTLSPKDWAVLARTCPTLRDLEVAAVVPHRPRAAKGSAAAGAGNGAVPDWFLRATVGDEAAYSGYSGGTSAGSDGHAPSRPRSARQRSEGDSSDGGGNVSFAEKHDEQSGSLAAARAAVSAAGCPFAHLTGGAKTGSSSWTAGAAGKREGAKATGAEAVPMPGLRRLVLWQYVAPWQLVQLVQLLPGLQDLQAALLMDDPPNVPAAVLRPAAVAALRPLIEVLRPLRDVRLWVSCDPAAVTGQLAGVFLMDSGMAEVPGIRGLALNVWVAAQIQLGSLAALSQLRSLELTLGKQEQESELSVLTRLLRLSYLSLRITPGIWNEIQGRTGRVTAGAALRLAMSFAAGQQLLFVADVHREICEDEAISLVKSVEMATGQIGSAWAVSAWVEETAECIMGFGPSAGGSGTLGGNGGGGDGLVLRVVWTPELIRRLLAVAAGVEGAACGGLAVSFMGAEEERLGRVLGS